LIDGGYISGQEFDRDIARLDDPSFMMPSPILWTAWGRRPSLQARLGSVTPYSDDSLLGGQSRRDGSWNGKLHQAVERVLSRSAA